MTEIIGHLREFSLKNCDWTIFKARLENYFTANGIKSATHAEKMRAVFLNVLDEDAYQLVFDMVSPDKPEGKKYEELIQVFDQFFKPQQSPLAARYKFYSARKEPTETASEWEARLRGLAVGCEFGSELKVCLRDKFIFGFEKGPILDRMMEERVTTDLEKMVSIAANKMAAQEIHDVMVKTEPIHHIRGARRPKQTARDGAQPSGNSWRGRGNAYVQGHSREQQQQQIHHGGNDNTGCEVCGRRNHQKDKCYFKNYSCNLCKKVGHLANVCKQKNNYNRNFRHHFLQDTTYNNNDNTNNLDDDSIFYFSNDRNIYIWEHTSDNTEDSFKVKIFIENIFLLFQVDTGSSVSCLSVDIYKQHFSNFPIKPTNKHFIFYNGSQVKPVGVVTLNIAYNKKEMFLDFYVMENGGQPLLGRDFLRLYNISLSMINNINTDEKQVRILTKEFSEVFSEGIGLFKNGVVKINIKKDAVPKFFKARPMPFSIKSQVEDELKRLLSLGIISPVDYSPWATPIVPVFKKNGKIRICGDFKVTINPEIEIDQHYMPRIDELFARLQGGKEFTKLDLSQAFQQIGLDEESKMLLTISTHLGLFKFNRLAFGVACASAKFQKIMDALFNGVEGCAVFQDDILVTGKDKTTHLQNLKKVLSILQNSGLKLNLDKCIFFAQSVEYLGFVIDNEGLHPSKSKTLAIEMAPRPNNVKELQAFLGSINFYGRFIKNLSSILNPLYKLLQKDTIWSWDDNCEKAFKKIKEILISSQVLVHFNPDLELRLTVDASKEGIGAVLSHKFQNSEEKPIAFASRTLSKAENNYSQIEKEGLAIIFGVLKFTQYLYNKKFTLVTDMRPLVTIFNPNKAIPQFSANRLRRWAIILSGYQYDIEYVTSNKNPADWLSRLPLKNSNDYFGDDEIDFEYCNFLVANSDIKLCFETIKKATFEDNLLKKVKDFILQGWPNKTNDIKLKPFFNKKHEFFIKDECIFWNHRIVIPNSLQKNILEQLHSTHLGIVKMKNLARSYIWFPNLDKNIENMAKTCEACLLHSNNAPKAQIVPWPWPNKPWERIHVDYFDFKRKNFLVILDAHSKWLEVFEMSTINSNSTIKVLRSLFARFGLPITLVSDNGRSLISDEFEEFLSRNNIQHLTSPPYSPSSNGAAENSVKTVKNALKKALAASSGSDYSLILSRFLFDYRNTDHATTGVSPAILMFGRKLRTRFSTFLPNATSLDESKINNSNDVRKRVENLQKSQTHYKGGKDKITFSIGEIVLVKDYRNVSHPTYIKGKIVRIMGKRSYLVEVTDLNKTWKRHLNQIKKFSGNLKIPHIPIESVTSPKNSLESSDEQSNFSENRHEMANEYKFNSNDQPPSPSSSKVFLENNATPILRRSKRIKNNK